MASQIALSYAAPHATNSTPTCSSASFQHLTLPDTTILSINTSEIHNFTSLNTLGSFGGFLAADYHNLNICSVALTYTHPGQNDTINVNIWLPLSPTAWNGRFQGTGGGGFTTGTPSLTFGPAIGLGWASAATDGGHPYDPVLGLPEYWALDAAGNVNEQLLLDFAYLALYEMSLLGKAVTAAYYGREPHHSYWHGCSTGGRQGLAMAQRYPDLYDGILALSPAINWARGIVPQQWPQLVMNTIGYSPLRCELLAMTAKAIEACDGLDGVVDGIISLPSLCEFDAGTLVGSSFTCEGVELAFSAEAAEVVNAAWTGPRNATTGEVEWFGLTKDASLVTVASGLSGLVDTVCTNDTDASTCVGAPFEVTSDWIQYFLLKDPDLDLASLTIADYDALVKQSTTEYGEIMDTSNPDLSEFRAGGGKMITTHGLADSLIYPDGSTMYYDRVLAEDAAAEDFYRLFLLPGVAHCFASASVGPYPTDQLEALTRWVEEGEAPDTLTTSFSLVPGGKTGERPACAYPAVQRYVGGDPSVASSFTCT